MGGRHFTVPCTLSKNGYGITLSALVDSGANGFAFMDTACANDISTFLNLKPEPLVRPIIPKGFDGQPGKAVTHMLTLHLSLDGQRQEDIPFMILDLGNHDVILGLKWMSYFNVWLKPRDKRLMWPDEPKHPTPLSFQREILVPRTALCHGKIQPKHQQDVYARDQAFTLEDQRRKYGRQPTPAIQVISRLEQPLADHKPSVKPIPASALPVTTRRTYDQDLRNQLQAMDRELSSQLLVDSSKTTRRTTPKTLPLVNIAQISATGFHFNMHLPDNEVFSTTMYEIDLLIEEKEALATEDQETVDLIRTKLPAAYQGFTDVFSKQASDELPPFRPQVDHKIELTSKTLWDTAHCIAKPQKSYWRSRSTCWKTWTRALLFLV